MDLEVWSRWAECGCLAGGEEAKGGRSRSRLSGIATYSLVKARTDFVGR